MIIFILVAVFVVVVGLVILFSILNKKCPKCKKIGLKKIGEEEIDRQHTKRRVENAVRDSSGKVVRTTSKEIPVVRITYLVKYKCKYCGEEVTKKKVREEKPLFY